MKWYTRVVIGCTALDVWKSLCGWLRIFEENVHSFIFCHSVELLVSFDSFLYYVELIYKSVFGFMLFGIMLFHKVKICIFYFSIYKNRTRYHKGHNPPKRFSNYCSSHHDKIVILFCWHDDLFCDSWMSKYHDSCTSILSMERLAESVNYNSALTVLEKRLEVVKEISKIKQNIIVLLDDIGSSL